MLQPTERQQLDRWLAVARQVLGEAAADAAWAAGRALAVDVAVAEALAEPPRADRGAGAGACTGQGAGAPR
jgi:hypothetical protein